MQNKTALIVDDSRVARLTLSKLLQSNGFEVIEYGSAEEALQWLPQASPLPTLIFMDVMMGGMDGLSATRQIKADSRFAGIPVVVCTGKESEADLEQALASGAAAVLAKPPAAEALNRVLDDVTAAAKVEPAQPASVPMDALLDALRAQLLPELEQKLSASLAPLQQQINEQATEKDNPTALDKLSEVTAQISGSVQQQFSDLKQSFSAQAEQLVNDTAEKTIDTAIHNFGLTEKLMSVLRDEGSTWLQQQQATMQGNLQQEISDSLELAVQAQLDEKLPELMDLQQAVVSQQQEKIDALESQLGLQRNIAFAALAVAVAAVIVAFI